MTAAGLHLQRLVPALLLAPGLARADFSWNLPEPVTPLARDTYGVHNQFMVIIVALTIPTRRECPD